MRGVRGRKELAKSDDSPGSLMLTLRTGIKGGIKGVRPFVATPVSLNGQNRPLN
jgi:hypothetical protein